MKSTFSRTLFTVVLLLLTSLLLIGITFRHLANDYLTNAAMDDLKNDAQVLVRLASSAYTDGSLSNHDFIVSLSITAATSGNDAVVFDSDGTLLMCSRAPLGCDHQGLPLESSYREQIDRQGICQDICVLPELYSDIRYVVAMPIREADSDRLIGYVLVSTPTAATTTVLEKISQIFTYVATVVILAGVILMVLFVRKQSSPLTQMAQTARAFGHGDLSARVKLDETHPREITELALAFNNMAASLEKSEYQRREFVANVSHELKTPMTTIAGYVDGILDGTIPPQRQEYYLQVVSDETKRLNRLVRSMLDISQLQERGGIPEEQMLHFDLCECAGRVLLSFEQKITEKDLQVVVDFPPHPVFTIAHQDYITQVVYNLVDNAVKFCPQGGVLEIRLKEGGNKIYVSVANDGPTIPADELPLLFDRFHKTDKSRTQNRDSWGLGLYIVKTIVCAHGENISVASRDDRTTFTFTMPLVN